MEFLGWEHAASTGLLVPMRIGSCGQASSQMSNSRTSVWRVIDTEHGLSESPGNT